MGKRIPAKKTATVIERDGGLCFLRISPDCLGEATVADHRANRGNGGANSLDGYSNLIAACTLCNGFKESGANRGELLARGVRVQSDSTHEKTAIRALNTPVVDVNGRTWWLDNTGLRHDRQPQPY